MEKKISAVEWLTNELLYLDNEFDMSLIDKNEYQKRRKKIVEQAKQMQDEQMQLIWNNAIDAVQKDKWHSYYEFYNNNFKSE